MMRRKKPHPDIILWHLDSEQVI